MKFFYDTEFLEDGRTIELISIGIVAEDGREYYAISDRVVDGKLNDRIRQHPWLMANVVPSLPPLRKEDSPWLFDYLHPDVKPRPVIAEEVREFLTVGLKPPSESAELWAWYGAYDHVALCQLWGPMMGLPSGIPKYTKDLKQEADRLRVRLPDQPSGLHNALEDARFNATRWSLLREVKEQQRQQRREEWEAHLTKEEVSP